MAFFFKTRITGGAPAIDEKETFALQFVHPDEVKNVWCVQQERMLEDAKSRKRGVFR